MALHLNFDKLDFRQIATEKGHIQFPFRKSYRVEFPPYKYFLQLLVKFIELDESSETVQHFNSVVSDIWQTNGKESY